MQFDIHNQIPPFLKVKVVKIRLLLLLSLLAISASSAQSQDSFTSSSACDPRGNTELAEICLRLSERATLEKNAALTTALGQTGLAYQIVGLKPELALSLLQASLAEKEKQSLNNDSCLPELYGIECAYLNLAKYSDSAEITRRILKEHENSRSTDLLIEDLFRLDESLHNARKVNDEIVVLQRLISTFENEAGLSDSQIYKLVARLNSRGKYPDVLRFGIPLQRKGQLFVWRESLESDLLNAYIMTGRVKEAAILLPRLHSRFSFKADREAWSYDYCYGKIGGSGGSSGEFTIGPIPLGWKAGQVKNVQTLFNTAYRLECAKRHEDAKVNFRRVLNLPEKVRGKIEGTAALCGLAWVSSRQGNYEEVARILKLIKDRETR